MCQRLTSVQERNCEQIKKATAFKDPPLSWWAESQHTSMSYIQRETEKEL